MRNRIENVIWWPVIVFHFQREICCAALIMQALSIKSRFRWGINSLYFKYLYYIFIALFIIGLFCVFRGVSIFPRIGQFSFLGKFCSGNCFGGQTDILFHCKDKSSIKPAIWRLGWELGLSWELFSIGKRLIIQIKGSTFSYENVLRNLNNPIRKAIQIGFSHILTINYMIGTDWP